ncbi:hypothetical protein [Streptomyces sp. PAM3C]|uniref:hypothetical protein n=1 Tax=Streptomyces sp. PAM3C TaxID=2847300 RepID=UPI001C1E535E|nr:hypothetical protein [Streptomyces sp. PAM3C]MBU5943269.1 hypothetical protein [Streptomyces sp. PAM3C]
MNDPTPEDGEPTSLTEKAKTLCRKHKGKLIAVGTTVLVVAVVIKKAMEQNAQYAEDVENSWDAQDTEDAEDSRETENTGSDSDRDEGRKSPVEHEVSDHTRTLRDGRVIPIRRYKRGGASDDGNEGPDEAAA